ncbi:MAG: hypothetical protein A2015_16945 [Spirochaetes bacterium GWF1_31_7]|nr:MAG: hypothetical protein A2Y30_14310 [Spirochaetes bacterium GWE1_32_154]OHD50130.1 MAG: hypothetical protein A2Y29_12355 [Spirochaetes bacterium GWE2_31_10]OHD52444.1 MAG: hypothetical protein A2015_16945 [Spirochaetes bacterium GWF1_31_7]OHD80090.1 MAG: hypothetical protein A2355_12045 [Spirochaetes bacterium RIFOXYB1_FULL_32_8]HBD96089.1 hypothetical protein [Spirochaetia bacterium]
MNRIIISFIVICMLSGCVNTKKNVKLSQVLLGIREESMKKKYSNIKDKYLYSIEIYNNDKSKIVFNSGSFILNGILFFKEDEDFAYSDDAALYHSQFVDAMAIDVNQEIIEKYLNEYNILEYDRNLQSLIDESPSNVKCYINGKTVLLFVNDNGSYKLFFTVDMTAQG